MLDQFLTFYSETFDSIFVPIFHVSPDSPEGLGIMAGISLVCVAVFALCNVAEEYLTKKAGA